MVRVYLLQKTVHELALDILELDFQLEEIAAKDIAETWINDWDLEDTCCKE